MKESEARDLLGMLKAATTQYPLDDETVGFWIDGLVFLDPDFATKAVFTGIKSWQQFPPWAQFYEIYRMIQRNAQAASREATVVTEGKHGYATPEWVWVWSWARFRRDPPEERSFPQQTDFADPRRMMMQEQYEALRDEWLAAGSPKAKNPIPLTIGGAP